MKHDTETEGRKHCWSLLRMLFPGYVEPGGILDIRLLRHDDEGAFVQRVHALVCCFGESVYF